MKLKRQLLDALSEIAAFPVPESMVASEFDQIWQRVEADRKAGRVDEDDSGKDDDTLKAEYRGIAERRVRLGLLLAEIGRVNSVVVAPDEMQRAMRTEAGRYPGQEQQVMDFFRKNPQAAESLRGPLFEEKVVDYIVDLAKVDRQVGHARGTRCRSQRVGLGSHAGSGGRGAARRRRAGRVGAADRCRSDGGDVRLTIGRLPPTAYFNLFGGSLGLGTRLAGAQEGTGSYEGS